MGHFWGLPRSGTDTWVGAEFAHHACVGFLRVPRSPSTLQRHSLNAYTVLNNP